MKLKEYSFSPAAKMWYAQPDGLLRLDFTSGVDGARDWALVLPPAAGVDKWIVVIHGHGSLGDQLFTRPDIRELWLPQYLKRGYGIITPNTRGNGWMAPVVAEDFDGILDLIGEKYGPCKFRFESGSMGGTSILIYAVLHPEKINGMIIRGGAPDLPAYLEFCRKHESEVPVLTEIAEAIMANYGGTPEEKPEVYFAHSAINHPERLRGIPLYYAHGSNDEIMPVSCSRRLAAKLCDREDFAYLEMPGGDHDSPLGVGYDVQTASLNPLDWLDRMTK